MFKDTKMGIRHHHRDSCYKCLMCGEHFFIEDQARRCNHDYSIAEYYDRARDNKDLTNK